MTNQDDPPYTIDDPDLNTLLNLTHDMSIGYHLNIGDIHLAEQWMEALEKVETRLACMKAIEPWSNMIALYEHVNSLRGSDCGKEVSTLLRRFAKYFPQPVESGPAETEVTRLEGTVVRSVREIEEGSFQYPVKVIVAYTLAGVYSNVALNKDDLLRYVATGLDASPIAEVSLIESYHEDCRGVDEPTTWFCQCGAANDMGKRCTNCKRSMEESE